MAVSFLVTSTLLYLNNLITVNVVTSTLFSKSHLHFLLFSKSLVNALLFCMFYFVFLSYTSRVPASSRYSGRRYSRYWRVLHRPLTSMGRVFFHRRVLLYIIFIIFHYMGLAIRQKKNSIYSTKIAHNTWGNSINFTFFQSIWKFDLVSWCLSGIVLPRIQDMKMNIRTRAVIKIIFL